MKPGTLLLLLACGGAGAAEPGPEVPLPSYDKKWLGKHNYLSGLVLHAGREAPPDIYFLGDSITEFWPILGKDVWKKEFGGMRVLNCGVAGDTTQNILYRITHGEFDHIAPKVVVVLAGINNLGLKADLSPDDLARGVRRIVATIRAKSPVSKVLLLSIFPSSEPADPVRRRIVETNKRLALLNDDKSVFYLDLYQAFLDQDGVFSTAISPDGTHLNAKGYQIWADAMRPTLQKLLAPAE
ncbi:MAG TPA: GDSL-type esterase/lipase family protein [Chthoniobacteraceae bacterium]|nr:GDSL-type esterase/lipase family protein [Chthoniobacteraceae bacterium]